MRNFSYFSMTFPFTVNFLLFFSLLTLAGNKWRMIDQSSRNQLENESTS